MFQSKSPYLVFWLHDSKTTVNWGEPALMSPVGVLGFIPKRQNYFACSYSEACRKALSEFYQEGRSKLQRQSSHLPSVANTSRQQFEVTQTHMFSLYCPPPAALNRFTLVQLSMVELQFHCNVIPPLKRMRGTTGQLSRGTNDRFMYYVSEIQIN